MILPALLLALIAQMSAPAAERIYIGAQDGIYTARVDPAGRWEGGVSRSVAAPNPNYLVQSADGKFLYAVQGAAGEIVACYAVGPDGGLTLVNQQPTGQKVGCHVSLSNDGRTLLLANYDPATVQSFAIGGDGRIGACLSTIALTGSGPNKTRQATAHAHSIYMSPDGRFVYACDLGSDRVWIFRLDARGALTWNSPAFAACPPGSGPRHLVFARDGRLVYVDNELGASVSLFARDAVTGALTLRGTTPCLPPKVPATGVTTAELALSADGTRLYVSSRTPDDLSVLSVTKDGGLRLERAYPLDPGVRTPRSFALDPRGGWLVVAGQGSDSIGLYRGLHHHLFLRCAYLHAPTPMCVIVRPGYFPPVEETPSPLGAAVTGSDL